MAYLRQKSPEEPPMRLARIMTMTSGSVILSRSSRHAQGIFMSSGDWGQQPGQSGPAGQPGETWQPGQPGTTPYGQPSAPGWGQPRKTNGLAIAALVCGIGQLLLGILAGIPGIILGFVALSQIRRTGDNGRGMAIAGIVLGFIGIALFVILIVAIAVAGSHANSG
jgi:hypothetical protein